MIEIKFYGVRGGFPTQEQMVSILISDGQHKALLDCGSTNIFSDNKLVSDLELILISHNDLDHICMLPHLILAKTILSEKGLDVITPTICSPEPITHIMRPMGLVEGFHYHYSTNISGEYYGWELETCNAKHTKPTYSYKIKIGANIIVYTGDTSIHNDLINFCSDANIIVCDASFSIDQEDLCVKWGHMSPRSVATLINACDFQTVLLTHFNRVEGNIFVSQLDQILSNDKRPNILVSKDWLSNFFD